MAVVSEVGAADRALVSIPELYWMILGAGGKPGEGVCGEEGGRGGRRWMGQGGGGVAIMSLVSSMQSLWLWQRSSQCVLAVSSFRMPAEVIKCLAMVHSHCRHLCETIKSYK